MLINTLDAPQVFADMTTGLGIGAERTSFQVTSGVDLNLPPEEIQKVIEKAGSDQGLVTSVKITKFDIDTTAAKEALGDAKANFDEIAKNQQILSAPVVLPQPDGYVQTGRDFSGTADNTGVQHPYTSSVTQYPTDWSVSGNAIMPPVVTPGDTQQVQQYNAYVTSATEDITGASETIRSASSDMSTSVVDSFDAIKDTALQNFGTDIPQALGDTNEQLEIAVVSADDLQNNGGARINAFGQIAITTAGQVVTAWQGVQSALAGAAGALPTAPTVATGTGQDTTSRIDEAKNNGFATGGAASGWAQVGEAGPELANFGQSGGSILNNQTFSKILDAMQAVIGGMGGMGGGSPVTNNFNINVVNNNKGTAARAGSDTRLASAIRGF